MELDKAFWLLSLQLIVLFSHLNFYWFFSKHSTLNLFFISRNRYYGSFDTRHAAFCHNMYFITEGAGIFFFSAHFFHHEDKLKISVNYKNTNLEKTSYPWLSALDHLCCCLLWRLFLKSCCWWKAGLWMCDEVHLTALASGNFFFFCFSLLFFSQFSFLGRGGKSYFAVSSIEWTKHVWHGQRLWAGAPSNVAVKADVL